MKEGEMGWICSSNEGYEKLYKILVTKPEGRKLLG